MVAVAPLRTTDMWRWREATMGGAAETVLAPFAQHVDAPEVDFLIVHRKGAERVVMLPWRFWKRVLMTLAKAEGHPLAAETPR